jgi:hypothetical protein
VTQAGRAVQARPVAILRHIQRSHGLVIVNSFRRD